MAEEVKVDFNAEEAFKRMKFDGRKLENRVHLVTGQFVGDYSTISLLTFDVMKMGYDGIGVATWGPSGIDVPTAVGPNGKEYLEMYIRALDAAGLAVSTISDHLVGQALAAAIIDEPLLGILPDNVREGLAPIVIANTPALHERVRFNAALHMMDTARVAERFREVAKDLLGEEKQLAMYNPNVIAGFTGSPTWHLLAGFPPVSEAVVERGYQEVAYRIARVLDVYRDTGNKFALETHPGEIAYDLITALRTDDTINRPEFGFNGDSSHSVGRGWNYLTYLEKIAERGKLFSTHLKGAAERLGDGSGGVYRSHLPWGDEMAFWDFKSIGRGTQDEGAVIYKLGDVGYKGALENEWEDAQLDKIAGATASLKIVKGFVTGNEALIMEGLKMYEDPANYKRARFDAAFEKR